MAQEEGYNMLKYALVMDMIETLRENNSVILEKVEENNRLLNGLILGEFRKAYKAKD
jgi:hypothetical protein